LLPNVALESLLGEAGMAIRYSVDDANVAWRVTDDEAIILHADSSAYFGLNRSGTLLWAQLAERPMTVDQLTTWSQQHFLGTPATLRHEINTFIDQLQKGYLLGAEDVADDTPGQDEHAGADQTIPWDPPLAECFGELEKLILSGE
jgi:hypothetical protein